MYATYNPEGYSFFHWAIAPITRAQTDVITAQAPLKVLAGLCLLGLWIFFVHSTRRSIGAKGALLLLGILGALVWLLVDWHVLNPASSRAIGHVILIAISIVLAIGLSIAVLGVAYVAAGLSTTLWQFIAVHFLIGLGSSATFGPLMAEASHWFERYRGLAVTIVASGNYVGGTIWPQLVNWGIQSSGWRTTHIAVGIFAAVAMTLVLLLLRAQLGVATRRNHENAPPPRVDLRLSTNTLTVMLCIASIACCVAMAMPQVHIVAYCGDLGYGVARGSEMLSLMMAFGVVSRIGSGFLADRIGGIRTLLIGSLAQGFALFFYLFFTSLPSLYVISAMFGLFQGGIVPSYAIIVREAMPASQAATRVGIVIFASVFGMSFGGWVSGVIFDATGSYAAAFLNGLGWNALNITIVAALLLRARQRLAIASGVHTA